jgi:pathogenesis-related protein 1
VCQGGDDPADCTFVPDTALASGEDGANVGATAAHNEWRVRVGVPRLKWNTTLAAQAQQYADSCPSGHSNRSERAQNSGFNKVGENIYWAGWNTDTPTAVDSWVNERTEWDFGMVIGDGNFADYGHYTQVVWDDTTDVGCGVAHGCSWQTTVVCRYGPAGNYTGQAPYDYAQNACYDLDNDDYFQSEDSDDTDRNKH